MWRGGREALTRKVGLQVWRVRSWDRHCRKSGTLSQWQLGREQNQEDCRFLVGSSSELLRDQGLSQRQ